MRRSSQASVPVLAQATLERHEVHRTKRASSSQRSKKRALVRRSKAQGDNACVQTPDAGTAGEDVPECWYVSELQCDIPWGYTLGRQVQHVYELVPDDERVPDASWPGSQEPENALKGAGIAGGSKTRTWCIEGRYQPPQGYRLGRCTGAINFCGDIQQRYELVPTGIPSPALLQRLKDVRAAVKAAESKLAELEEGFNVR